jgi:hypothetical protein
VQDGCAVEVEPWQLLSRGLHRERPEDGLIVGDLSDEVTQRGIWRHWKKVMMQRDPHKERARDPIGNASAVARPQG